jgi:hypothetical protein
MASKSSEMNIIVSHITQAICCAIISSRFEYCCMVGDETSIGKRKMREKVCFFAHFSKLKKK